MDDSMHQYTIKDLAQFMQSAREDKDQKPFIFITGAGCSVTAGIPLANKIVSELNEKFALELKPLSDEDRKDYGKCMGRLETSKRRRYLQEYIGKAKINWSHIALACLIKEGYIRRVLTFNFDNLLARSCGLLGQYPPIYDFTAANLNLHRLIDDPAIVHLHGQGHGFVQLNTDSETEEHAARLKEFVGHTLSESPTLFIGYSGNNDAFLPQIEEQFSDQHRLFWVDMGDQAPEHLQQKLLTSSLAHYMSCENGSDLFLIQLAQKLGCFPPTIFADPYQHLLDELDEIANYPIPKEESSKERKESRLAHSNTSAQDILLETKNKLRKVQLQDKEGEADFLQEYLQGDYREIIQVLEGKNNLNHEQSLWLARVYFSLALKESRLEERVNIYRRLIDTFKESDELDLQEHVARALVNEGIALGELEQLENVVEVSDELIKRFGQSDEFALQEQVARALVSKGAALGGLEQLENVIEISDELIERFGESDDLVLQEHVARAMVNKGVALGRLEQPKSAIQVYNEIIEKFGKSNELVLQDQMANVLLNKGFELRGLEQLENAIQVYDELIERFGESDDLVLQEHVSRAMVNKGVTLETLEQPENAIQIYNEIIERFGESKEVGLQNSVAIALNDMGYLKLLAAKKQWQDTHIAKDYLHKASKDFSKALTKSSRDNHALILGNVAYTEFLQGNMTDSESHLRKALQQGGQSIYDEVVKDISKYPIELDNDFKILLEKIWNEIKE